MPDHKPDKRCKKCGKKMKFSEYSGQYQMYGYILMIVTLISGGTLLPITGILGGIVFYNYQKGHCDSC